MQIRFNVTGPERKRLVSTVADTLEVKAKYLGAPTMAYEIDTYTVTKDGTLEFSDRNDSEEVERVLEALIDAGFEPESKEETQTGEKTGADALTITLPLDGMDEAAFDRLTRLVNSKAALIKKALGAERLDILPDWDNGTMTFPWFDRVPEFEEIEAYSAFICALIKMAKESTRVTAVEKEVESEKYAFRGFLLRLGFIGEDSKKHRKVLMKNLSGSAAFPNKEAADAFSAAQKAKREAAKEVQA